MREYRQWVNSSLRTELDKSSDDSREKLHASLALLPVDASQVDYLFARLIKATPSELPVLRDALKTHRSTLTPKLWTVLEPAKPGDGGLLPTASALASYAPDDPRWEGLAGKVSQALVSVNPVFLGSWLDALRPVRSKLTSPLATLFQERSVPETEQTLVTNILADYARDDPDRLAELLMVADPKAYVSLFPIVEKRAEQILPVFQAELAREATYSWNDPPLDPSWTEPSADLKGRIESAHGMVEKRFAFCQTMPLDRFVTTAKALDNSGYRPVRFRPFADGQDVKVAAVWTRDGCKWRMASGLTAEQVRTQDDELGQGSPDPAQTAGRVGRGSPGTRRVAAHDADRRSPALGESADSGRPSVPGRAGSGDPRPTLAGDLAMTKYVPVDVAGYEATDPQGKAAIHYAALWVEQTRPDDDAQMYVAATANEEKEAWKRLGGAKLVPRTQHALLGSDGKTRYCGVWGRPPRAGETARLPRHQSERNLEQSLATRSDQLLVDLAVSSAPPPTSTRVRAQASLAAAERILSAKPDDPIARYTRAMAYFHLGEDLKALVDLGLLIEKAPQFADVRHARVYRAIIHARLGQKKEAQEDLAFFQKGSTPESSKLYLAVVVASELGAGQSAAFERLEVALKRQPGDSGLAYDAACAYALASRALAKTDRASSERHAGRAIRLLEAAIKSGYSDYDHIQEDSDLDPIRDLPAFVDLIKESHPDRLYSEVWSADIRFDSKQSHGLDPAAQLRRCHELIAQGYRPVSLSTARTLPDGPLVTASVWHRPSVSEQARDDLAERQARAAAALVRLGRPAQVWPLLVHSPDPRLRSFIVNGLRPRGANPEVIAAEFDRLVKVGRGNDVGRGSPDPSQEPDRVGRGSPDPAQGADRRSPAPGASADSGTPSVPERAATLPVPGDARPTLSGDPRSRAARATNVMDAILFHPETSTLRALILTLGTYGAEWLSPGERDPLTAKLLDLYENDPDAGIHGAAEWTLRQWKQEERLKSAQAELSKLKDRGHRRWLINSQGQTFAVIDGPVQFRIGSPRGELDRDADELPHPRVIPRRFAIADKEVTVEQYDRFARAKPQFGLARSYLDKHSPEANGPMIGVSWFGAVAYCNWLSEQEGLPTDQWCYLPNDRRDYDAGMTIPADSFKRKGYRLPAEAEWEYACRAGTVTSRYYGLSKSLLEAYARYAANSNEHAWAGGRLLPNDLGLFDMLGNVYEWCQERNATYQPGGVESIHDEIINLRVPRLIRGGAFDYSPASVRSALRTGLLPWSQTSDSGFRLARTYQ